MAFSGKIEDLPIFDILQYLHAGNKTGTLIVTRENDTAYVYFQDGQVIHALSPQRTHIGELLVESREITLKTLQKALVLQAEDKERPVGQILVELAAISRERLKEVLSQQTQQAIYHLVNWVDGEFTFEPNEMIPVDDITLNPTTVLPVCRIDTSQLLFRSLEHMDSRRNGDPEKPGFPPESAMATGHVGPTPCTKPPRMTRGRMAEAGPPGDEDPALDSFERSKPAAKSVPALLLTSDPFFKDLLRGKLFEKGVEIVTPAALEECLFHCRTYFDKGLSLFVLVEDQMSETNRRQGTGITILTEKERSGWPFPVLILSSRLSPERMVDYYKAGARAVFPKPVRDAFMEGPYIQAIESLSDALWMTMRPSYETHPAQNRAGTIG